MVRMREVQEFVVVEGFVWGMSEISSTSVRLSCLVQRRVRLCAELAQWL